MSHQILVSFEWSDTKVDINVQEWFISKYSTIKGSCGLVPGRDDPDKALQGAVQAKSWAQSRQGNPGEAFKEAHSMQSPGHILST